MYGINGIHNTYGILPNNDFLVRILEPGLEEQLEFDYKRQLLVEEEKHFFDSALRCSSCIHAYESFVKKYDDAGLGIDFSTRLKQLTVHSKKENAAKNIPFQGCFSFTECDLID